MQEAGQRQLLGANRAAGAGLRLQHRDVVARLGEPDRRREPVRARADHDRPAHAATARASWWSMLSRSTPPSPQKACWASLPATA